MKKLIVKTNSENQAVLFEVEIEKDGEGFKTVYVYRERLAEPKEVLLYHTGYGRMIRF